MNENVVERVRIVHIKRSEEKSEDRELIKEIPLTIFLNGEELVTLLCTPQDLKYLAVGFLATSGFIRKKEDIGEIFLDEERGIIKIEVKDSPELPKKFTKRMITSGCGKGTLFYGLSDVFGCSIAQDDAKFKLEQIFNLMKKFQKSSPLFKKTGGVHSAALCKEGEIVKQNEDIGRHNAIDKILGECFLEGIPMDDKVVLTSGRISSEIVLKVAKCNIPVIVSRCAPTHLAVKLAEKLKITLIGFVRGGRMNIYTYPQRIVYE
jgi:FdhD protein